LIATVRQSTHDAEPGADPAKLGAAALECTDLRKRYPGRTEFALGDEREGIQLQVGSGELFALLGPSGCGKTTTLRIVGGFVEPTSGSVQIEGRDVTNTPPYRRPTNTVFQNYALFPHMSVGENVAFGLKMGRVSKQERASRVEAALDLVGLSGYGRQRVAELSGGQAQRAALARAMVLNPQILLLDEPLGALDLKLRRQMQEELVALRERTGTTFIHVTHDQEEACAIADRIAVMDRGKIVQIDSPADLYQRPRNTIVAMFLDIGTIFRGPARRDGDVVHVDTPLMAIAGEARSPLSEGGRVAAVLPPHCVGVNVPGSSSDGRAELSATVEHVTFSGDAFEVRAAVAGAQPIRASLPPHDVKALGEQLAAGRRVQLSWDPKDVILVEDLGDAAEETENSVAR
jgi:ABC-type Fe3+/spermidine/putrescine transport system ATPase subunit